MVLDHSESHDSKSPAKQVQGFPEKYNLLDFSFFEWGSQSWILFIELGHLDVIQIFREAKNLQEYQDQCCSEGNKDDYRENGRHLGENSVILEPHIIEVY